MSENLQEKPPQFDLWERVKIRRSGGMRGRIVELRGALAPGRVQVYRIRIIRKVPGTRPIRSYVEVREDQLERIPAKA